MMLRTLPARSGFLWVLLACISLAGCTRHPKYSLQTEAALERLDAELSRKDRYQQWRQAQNDSLRREVARARNAGDRAWRLFAVSQNYVTYQLDSAAYYVDPPYRLGRPRRREATEKGIGTEADKNQNQYPKHTT